MSEQGSINFDRRKETEHDIRGSIVLVIRTFFSGIEEQFCLPASCAVELILHDELNGSAYRSARIDWGDVYAPDWDMSA
jgi:hypothetical protein